MGGTRRSIGLRPGRQVPNDPSTPPVRAGWTAASLRGGEFVPDLRPARHQTGAGPAPGARARCGHRAPPEHPWPSRRSPAPGLPDPRGAPIGRVVPFGARTQRPPRLGAGLVERPVRDVLEPRGRRHGATRREVHRIRYRRADVPPQRDRGAVNAFSPRPGGRNRGPYRPQWAYGDARTLVARAAPSALSKADGALAPSGSRRRPPILPIASGGRAAVAPPASGIPRAHGRRGPSRLDGMGRPIPSTTP
jgi:hypothetical protein